jgi:hypothetical protein
MKWFTAAIFCVLAFTIWAQNTPITLDVQTSTRYYTDGTSKSSAKMLWSTDGVQPQTIGFLGKRIRPYLNESPEVQKRFGTFRTFSALQIATGVGTLATLPVAFKRQEEFPEAKWYNQFRAPLIFGVSSYATAIAAGIAFNRAINAHNALVGGGSDEGFGWSPQVLASEEVAGLALVWTW